MATLSDMDFPQDFSLYSRREDYDDTTTNMLMGNDNINNEEEDSMMIDSDNDDDDAFEHRHELLQNVGVNPAVLMIDPCADEASFEQELLKAGPSSNSTSAAANNSFTSSSYLPPVFKSSSPYTTGEQYKPLTTIVPSDILIKSPEDNFYGAFGNRFTSPFNEPMDNDLRFYIEPQHNVDQGFFENPEDEEEEEEEDDDDDFDFDDENLYSPDEASSSRSSSSMVAMDKELTPGSSASASTTTTDNTHAINHLEMKQKLENHHDEMAVSQTPSPGPGFVIHKGPGRKKIASTGPHRCEIVNAVSGQPCNKVFSRPYDLIRHQDTIHAPVRKTFKCEYCGDESKTFSRMDALSRHIRVKHS